MIDAPLIFLAGLLGSSHCLGMCGPFALSIGSGAPRWRVNVARQLIYSAGRLFTYMALGAIAGYGGLRFSQAASRWVQLPALLAVVAGVLLVYQGLASAGVRRRGGVPASGGPCLASSFFAGFLNGSRHGNYFLAGMFTGFLPCGLVYAFLTLAASSAQLAKGMALMGLFGLGTVPLMVAIGCGGGWLSGVARLRLLRLAAWCVVLAGVVSIFRGLGFVHIPGWLDTPGCPFCHS